MEENSLIIHIGYPNNIYALNFRRHVNVRAYIFPSLCLVLIYADAAPEDILAVFCSLASNIDEF